MLVSSPDSHALRAKDSLEQLPQILGQASNKDENAWLTMDNARMTLGQEFKGTVPDHLSPIGCGGLGMRLTSNSDL